MEIREIQEKWIRRESDVEAEVAAWDLVAGEYIREEKQNFHEDPFLRFVSQRIPLEEQSLVLDVGCGAGAYAEAIAERAREVHGLDFSPEMIRLAQKSAQERGIRNLRYLRRDWYTCNGAEFRQKYDFVYAHTTPAVADYTTFRKLYDASRRFGMFCRPARRTDSVFDEVHRIAGLPSRHPDDAVSYAFELLWALGACPEVRHDPVVWHPERTIKDAEIWYLGRLKDRLANEQNKQRLIRSFLEGIAEDGIIREEIRTTLVTFFWERPDSQDS